MDKDSAETFLYQEARLLDKGLFRQWRELFAADFIYWVPANDPNADPTENCSIIYNGPNELDDRIGRLESSHFWAGDPPFKTLHLVSNVTVGESATTQVTLESNLVLYVYRDNDQRRDVPMQTLPGLCEHRLVSNGGGDWKIAFKKVTLLNCDGLVPLLPPVL